MALKRGTLVASVALVIVAFGCSDGSSSTAASTRTLALPPAGNTVADLKATAAAWAKAFLVGGLGDITALQGPQCTEHPGTTLPAATVAVYLRSERAALAQHSVAVCARSGSEASTSATSGGPRVRPS